MANPERTLSLKILGDTKNLVDALGKGSKETESFGKQVGDISAKVIKSFLAIGAAVGAFSIAFAKAAAEDQQAANKLAQTLDAVTSATNKQIQAVGNYITQTSLATGITDDELRPAFERLARSTKNVEESQTLLNLALDLSAATGKPLEAVTNALAKAYEGSYTSLQRLGVGLDANLIKSKDFDEVYKKLNSTFGEFSEKRSQETIVKFQRLQVALTEAKEAIGAALLPLFVRLGDWLLNEGVPRLNAFIAGLTGDKSVSAGFTQAQKDAEEFGAKIRSIFERMIEYKGIAITTGAAVATVFAVSNIAAGVAATVTAIQALIKAYNALRVSSLAAGIASMFALNPVLGALSGAAAFGAMGLAIKLFESQNIGIDGSAGLGNFQMSTGTVLGGGVGGGGGGILPGGSVPSFSNAAGGRSLSDISKGMVTSPEDLVSKLTSVSERISQIQFLYDTGQISKAKASTMLDAAQKEFNKLQAISAEFQSMQPTPTRQMSGVSRGEYANVTINVMAPSVIDEDGFSRAVQNAIQNAERRGTYTGGL